MRDARSLALFAFLASAGTLASHIERLIYLSRICGLMRILHRASEFVAWRRGLTANALHGLGDPVPDEVLAVMPVELREDFGKLVEFVVEIGMYDAYGAKTDAPRKFLMRSICLIEKHGVPPPSLEPFLQSPETPIFWTPVAEKTLAQWRLLAKL